MRGEEIERESQGKLWLIGIGPGGLKQITPAAQEAVRHCEVIVGYRLYVKLIEELLEGQEVIAKDLTQELERAKLAVQLAYAGRQVGVISSGDAGIYGMAGLVYEVLAQRGWQPDAGPEVEVLPGLSALNSCAARVGAPLMHDFVSISLSDLLTPWEMIRRRLQLAAEGDFVMVLYNPRSERRKSQLEEARQILLSVRSAETPVALVRNAYRTAEQVILTSLGNLQADEVDMLTTVLIGNSQTYVHAGRMITPRGYLQSDRG